MSLKYNKNLIKNAKELIKNMTRHEKHLWYDFLSDYPIRFQRQKTIDNYIVDFYCDKVKLAIELDGSQHFEDSEIENDLIRTKKLNDVGVEVLRFTNLEIDSNFNGVCQYIDMIVKKRLPPRGSCRKATEGESGNTPSTAKAVPLPQRGRQKGEKTF